VEGRCEELPFQHSTLILNTKIFVVPLPLQRGEREEKERRKREERDGEKRWRK
jgi:hypothetical protein